MLTTTAIERHIPLQIQHHDWGSLLAGKLHAILQRNYTKGRDWYDLVWYLTRPHSPQPNFIMLNHALIQSGWSKEPLTPQNWRQCVYERLQSLNWAKVIADVQPFLIESDAIRQLQRENVIALLLYQRR